jgi:hypothetical protein
VISSTVADHISVLTDAVAQVPGLAWLRASWRVLPGATRWRRGRARPAYFQLMFRPELSRSEKTPDLHAAGDAASQLLVEVARECQRAGTAPDGDPGPLVGMVWALGHGFAALWLDGPLEERCAGLGTTPAALTEQVVRLLKSTLANAARPR